MSDRSTPRLPAASERAEAKSTSEALDAVHLGALRRGEDQDSRRNKKETEEQGEATTAGSRGRGNGTNGGSQSQTGSHAPPHGHSVPSDVVRSGHDNDPLWVRQNNIKKVKGPRVRVATFNTENLVARYKFRAQQPSCDDTFTRIDTAFDLHDAAQKRLTAALICDVDADVLCLMEVESLSTLEYFNVTYLKPLNYHFSMLIEAHDPRFINVAVLSRYPIVACRSHKDDLDSNGSYLLTRSCLEVDIDVFGVPLTVYLNHFRSMRGSEDGRWESAQRRIQQAERVRDIVNARWSSVHFHGNFIVLGDLNDKNDKLSAIRALTRHPHLVNVVERLPKEEQWTHHFKAEDTYSQLDYLLVSKTLATTSCNLNTKPIILRHGLARRATRYTGFRYPAVGLDRPKASDHCPVSIDLHLFIPHVHPHIYPHPNPLPQPYKPLVPLSANSRRDGPSLILKGSRYTPLLETILQVRGPATSNSGLQKSPELVSSPGGTRLGYAEAARKQGHADSSTLAPRVGGGSLTPRLDPRQIARSPATNSRPIEPDNLPDLLLEQSADHPKHIRYKSTDATTADVAALQSMGHPDLNNSNVGQGVYSRSNGPLTPTLAALAAKHGKTTVGGPYGSVDADKLILQHQQQALNSTALAQLGTIYNGRSFFRGPSLDPESGAAKALPPSMFPRLITGTPNQPKPSASRTIVNPSSHSTKNVPRTDADEDLQQEGEGQAPEPQQPTMQMKSPDSRAGQSSFHPYPLYLPPPSLNYTNQGASATGLAGVGAPPPAVRDHVAYLISEDGDAISRRKMKKKIKQKRRQQERAEQEARRRRQRLGLDDSEEDGELYQEEGGDEVSSYNESYDTDDSSLWESASDTHPSQHTYDRPHRKDSATRSLFEHALSTREPAEDSKSVSSETPVSSKRKSYVQALLKDNLNSPSSVHSSPALRTPKGGKDQLSHQQLPQQQSYPKKGAQQEPEESENGESSEEMDEALLRRRAEQMRKSKARRKRSNKFRDEFDDDDDEDQFTFINDFALNGNKKGGRAGKISAHHKGGNAAQVRSSSHSRPIPEDRPQRAMGYDDLTDVTTDEEAIGGRSRKGKHGNKAQRNREAKLERARRLEEKERMKSQTATGGGLPRSQSQFLPHIVSSEHFGGVSARNDLGALYETRSEQGFGEGKRNDADLGLFSPQLSTRISDTGKSTKSGSYIGSDSEPGTQSPDRSQNAAQSPRDRPLQGIEPILLEQDQTLPEDNPTISRHASPDAEQLMRRLNRFGRRASLRDQLFGGASPTSPNAYEQIHLSVPEEEYFKAKDAQKQRQAVILTELRNAINNVIFLQNLYTAEFGDLPESHLQALRELQKLAPSQTQDTLRITVSAPSTVRQSPSASDSAASSTLPLPTPQSIDSQVSGGVDLRITVDSKSPAVLQPSADSGPSQSTIDHINSPSNVPPATFATTISKPEEHANDAIPELDKSLIEAQAQEAEQAVLEILQPHPERPQQAVSARPIRRHRRSRSDGLFRFEAHYPF